MTGQRTSCRHCAAPAQDDDRFCGSCGATLVEIERAAVPRDAGLLDGRGGPCPDCGNATYADEYCTTCGARRAAPDREEAHVGPVSLVTDRGLEHARNEDAASAGILVGADGSRPDAIAVAVCDGVSTSTDAHLAAVAAANAGVEAMLSALAAARTSRTAVLEGLAAAALAATEAGADVWNAPCCTYCAAVVVPAPEGAVEITVGNVGDSRAYWLPESPGAGRQLTVDDSVAQELIDAGLAVDSAAVQRGAHTLTRWLGADAEPKPWSESGVQTITVDGPGALVACTDGMWNYLPGADDLARVRAGTDSVAIARAFVDHALSSGGHDNVTAAVISIGERHEFG
ncbi:MAG: zinc ribbon domain-containing protein [Mycobacterium sp.]